MTVESLRKHYRSLAEFLRAVGGESSSADFERVGEALKPFDRLTVEGLEGLLAHAEEYQREGKIAANEPIHTATDLDAHIKRMDGELKAAKKRLPEMKQRDKAREKAEADRKKAAAKAAKDLEGGARKTKSKTANRATDEEVAKAANSIKNLTERAQSGEMDDNVIEAEIAKLKAFDRPQLLHIAKLIDADAGLNGRSSAKAITERITERLQGVKDSFDRADL